MTYKEKVLTAALFMCARRLTENIGETSPDYRILSPDAKEHAVAYATIYCMNLTATRAREDLSQVLEELEAANRVYEAEGGKDISEFGGTSE